MHRSLQRWLWLFVWLAVLLGTSAGQVPPQAEGWRQLAIDRLAPSQQQQWEQATAARDLLFERLMSRLKGVLEEQGAVRAIAVCQEEAPRLARAVSVEKKLAIGRTSHKLRTPKNQPPLWAKPWLDPKTATHPVLLAHADGRLGVLLPIYLKNQCLLCHGPAATIPEALRAELKRLYPDDQATGFAENELRGWFWVEVPPVAK
jgi:hypothetical protein